MSKHTLPTIPNEAIINLKISGTFYRKLMHAFFTLGNTDPVKFKEALENLNDDPKDDFSAQIQVLLMLIHDIEKEAQNQGLVKQQEIEIPED